MFMRAYNSLGEPLAEQIFLDGYLCEIIQPNCCPQVPRLSESLSLCLSGALCVWVRRCAEACVCVCVCCRVSMCVSARGAHAHISLHNAVSVVGCMQCRVFVGPRRALTHLDSIQPHEVDEATLDNVSESHDAEAIAPNHLHAGPEFSAAAAKGQSVPVPEAEGTWW
jgi:hypothetical protein